MGWSLNDKLIKCEIRCVRGLICFMLYACVYLAELALALSDLIYSVHAQCFFGKNYLPIKSNNV